MTALFVGGQAILLCFVVAGLTWWSQAQSSAHAAQVLSATVSRLTHDAESDNLQDTVQEELTSLKADGLTLEVRDRSGQVILRSGPPLPAHPHPRDWRTETFSLAGHQARLAYPWAPVQASQRREFGLLAIVALTVLLTSGAGAWILVGRSLAPIAALCREVEASESLDGRLRPPSRDAELVQLVATLNALLERAGDVLRLKERFYAAASHELRTPLQALSGHLELSLSRSRSLPESRATIEEAHHQTQRLVRLVRDLLLLTQLESNPLPPAEAVDVTDLCREVLERLDPLVRERSLAVTMEAENVLQVMAPPTHVEMLVRNLVENAVRYARPEGAVRVRTDSLMRVFNECPVPEDWNPEQCLEPFYRSASSIRAYPQGTGLGLTICHALASANGWTLELQAQAEGVEVVVDFHSSVTA